MSDGQVANSFDAATVKKIFIGALLSFSGSLALLLLNYVQTIQINNPMLAAIAVLVVPAAINAIKEYQSGVQNQ